MRSAKVLAWLENDELAKDDLRMRAAIFRLGFHQHNNTASGNFAGVGLKGTWVRSQEFPARGLDIGRALGWGLDAVNCAYAFGNDETRTTLAPWYSLLTESLAAGQMCNGFVMSKASPKVFGGLYNGRQQYEHAIMENAWWGAVATALLGRDPQHAAQMEGVIAKSALAMISPYSWSNAQHGPWSQLATGPLSDTEPMFCELPHPPGGISKGVDRFQCWSSFAYGYELTGNAALLQKAGEMAGGDLKAKLLAGGLNNVESKAALIALVQGQ
jgi:hypothetical protein